MLQRLIEQGTKVDLIYLDPPFNSNRAYNIIYDSRAADAQDKAFDDTWRYTSQIEQMLLDFEAHLEAEEALSAVVKAFLRTWIGNLQASDTTDKKMIAYLIYMTERLVLMHKVLRSTGSLYLHCDPTASHYLKVLLDGIFGKQNFRNEITWQRYATHSLSEREYNNITDILLFYSKEKGRNTFSHPYRASTKEEIQERFKHIEAETGRRFQHVALEQQSNASSAGELRHIQGKTVTSEIGWRWTQETFDTRLKDNPYLIHWTKNGRPRYKIYADEYKGEPTGNMWTSKDVKYLTSGSKERLGYKTQKPLALLKRIIAASSQEGDLVLDPFCGCGTTIEAAIQLKRNWMGIDISGDAIDLTISKRIRRYHIEYEKVEGAPDTRKEYERLSPYEKQDWLVRQLQGQPSLRKSGDQGVDGELRIHIGFKKEAKKQVDRWGRLLFSVKTGKQCTPSLVRELRGTISAQKAEMGVLILDQEPTLGMEQEADKAGELAYYFREDLPPDKLPRLQIITTDDIFDGRTVVRPPSIKEIMLHRQHAQARLL